MDRFNRQLLQRTRLIKGWTQQKLAEEAGLSKGAVARVEGGRTSRPDTIYRVAQALGLDMERVVE